MAILALLVSIEEVARELPAAMQGHPEISFGMSIVQGRGFSESLEGDAAGAVVVNEALVRDFGLKRAGRLDIRTIAETERPRIVGVVEDYHFKSMRTTIARRRCSSAQRCR